MSQLFLLQVVDMPSKKLHSESMHLNINNYSVRNKIFERLPSKESVTNCDAINSLSSLVKITHAEVNSPQVNSPQVIPDLMNSKNGLHLKILEQLLIIENKYSLTHY